MSSSNFAHGFADEIEKMAGVLSAVGKFVVKHPVATLFGAVPAAVGAGKAFAHGMSGPSAPPAGGEEEHVLQATAGHPSAMSDVNFHELIPHKLQPWEKFHLSRNYPSYRRGIGATK